VRAEHRADQSLAVRRLANDLDTARLQQNSASFDSPAL
jgi:hypothetical protein